MLPAIASLARVQLAENTFKGIAQEGGQQLSAEDASRGKAEKGPEGAVSYASGQAESKAVNY